MLGTLSDAAPLGSPRRANERSFAQAGTYLCTPDDWPRWTRPHSALAHLLGDDTIRSVYRWLTGRNYLRNSRCLSFG